jgi:hypothetical protein
MELAKIYYRKGTFHSLEKPNKIDMNDYELVCTHPIYRVPGHKDSDILESLFELFNWVHEGFQPNDSEIGFNKPDSIKHTSLSVNDIVEINETKYLCNSVGWKRLKD